MNEEYPATYAAAYEPHPNRVTTFFRIFVAIPWFFVGMFYAFAGIFSVFAAWIVIIVTGRNSDGIYRFNAGLVRYFTRLHAFVMLQTDQYPPFGLGHDDD